MKKATWILWLLLTCMTAGAQRFFNLTARQVRIDSLLPVVRYQVPLFDCFADSVYSVSIEYPEFLPMSDADIRHYQAITSEPLPRLPLVEHHVAVSRKQAALQVSLVPLVFRDGRYQKLVSFMLRVDSRPKKVGQGMARQTAAMTADRYAEHSVLSQGRWAKIRVPSTGIYQLTEELVRTAGFSDLSRVRIYGYGGGLQPERLTDDYLRATDDLREVPTCTVEGKRLFHAVGPVTWDDNHQRIRNPYSAYGYYFLTETDSQPTSVDAGTFQTDSYPLADDYHTLYEVDNYAWYQGGSQLYDAELLTGQREYSLTTSGRSGTGSVRVVISADQPVSVSVSVNGEQVGTLTTEACGTYDAMRTASNTFAVSNLRRDNQVTLLPSAATGQIRLDYISLYCDAPCDAPDWQTASFLSPEYVGQVEPQDLHADGPADMVIVIPASRQLLSQAERLKTLHEQYDALRVRIVTADQLYNEFSSGTPDANAYRRYLKMLYDRAKDESDMPRYLLLLGDGAWDNRMLSSAWHGYRPEDFLLCYESDNSYSHTDCYVTDDYFCLLDDGEGGNMLAGDQPDVAVGRFPVRTAEQAAVMVDKLEAYLSNRYAGAWQNVVCVMGDDGNQNQHMHDADEVATMIEQEHPAMQVRRIMWDAYARTTSATGNSYPDVTRLIKQQMQSGALMMNYAGHGAATTLSHEKVLSVGDFESSVSNHLPLWVTASCDIMPFDGQEENFGETALLNKRGGGIAFFGTTRTVYQSYNRMMNMAFSHYVFASEQGKRLAIGEAVRRAKNELISNSSDLTANKLQYSLLGDPALVLAMPLQKVEIDAVNDLPLSEMTELLQLPAGSVVTVRGHVCRADGQPDSGFSGEVTMTVRDAVEEIVCRRNAPEEADEAFVFHDRSKTLFAGTDSVRQGQFSCSFMVPRDISYSSAAGLISLYAVSDDRRQEANGYSDRVCFGGSGSESADEEGPSVYCYLNSQNFMNGGRVNTTPYFVAELADSSGINATGTGIGHDLQLVIDGELSRTYNLNDYFHYDFGSHTRGTVGFTIPQLPEGNHRLQFRAWDVLNHSTTSVLDFQVVKGLSPELLEVDCTQNPAVTTTSFRIIHDRVGSELDVVLDIFDTGGRHLWQHHERGVAVDNSYTIDWNLCVDGGRRLHTGVYLYRVRVSSDGSSQSSKAKKMIVISNK